MARSPRSPSTRTTPTSFTSAQRGAASGSRATAVTLGRLSSIERPRLAWATRARLRSILSTQTLCMSEPAAARGSQFAGETTQPPAGLFKSTDGGASWIRLGFGYPPGPPSNAHILFNLLITVVIVDPANTQTLYLASSAGIFFSTDGGFNWTKGVSPGGDVRSLVLDTTSPAGARILYAGVSGVGVVQSTDGGRNWHPILNAVTPAVATALTNLGLTGFSKVVVALAPPAALPDPAGIQVLYATMEGDDPTLSNDPSFTVGLFQSTDQGATWTARSATGLGVIGSPQWGYSFLMAVDPASPGDGVGDIIYFGAQGQARSTDAGGSFIALSGTPRRHACLGVRAATGSFLGRLFRQ